MNIDLLQELPFDISRKMPRLPAVEKFRGDFTQSYEHWIQEFQAHLTANGWEEEKHRDILLVCCEGAAFSTLINLLQQNAQANFEAMKNALRETYSGADYKRTLEVKLRNLKFNKGMKIPTFITELCQVIKELYNLQDQEAIKSIAMNHVLANLDSVMRDEVKLLQISGNMRLETLLEFIDSKFHNNTLQIQTFAHHASLPFTYQNPSNHASPIVQKTNQNDDIQEMKTMMKKLIDLQVNQHSAVRPPYQNRQRICNVCNKTGHTGDKCYLTKTCFICNQKGHISRNCTANTTPPGQSQGNVSTNAGKTREDLNENIQSNSFQKIKSVERI